MGTPIHQESRWIKNLKQFEVVVALSIVTGAMLLGYLLRDHIQQFSDIRDGDVVGTYGTIYALITAFILVNVWNHFNDIKNTYAGETEALIHLWNFVDFLDDETMSKAMHFTLLTYLDSILKVEFPKLARFESVQLPSVEFHKILHLLDMIDFEKSRTGIAFDAMVLSFKDLFHARNQRIEASLNRIPWLVKFFYFVSCLAFWVSFLLQYFESSLLYYFNLFSITIIVVLSYMIIFDLDKPLSGLLRISLENYTVCREYIKETIHSV